MPIATFSDYKDKLKSFNTQFIPFAYNAIASPGAYQDSYGLVYSSIAYSGPGTARVPTKATAGFLTFNNPTGKTLMLLGAEFSSAYPVTVELIDALSDIGGFNATTTGVQGFGTSALTRNTDGIGVLAGIGIYGQIGATGTTITFNYTNSSDTTNRQSPLRVIGGTSFREAGRFLRVPLVAGDVGIKSVQSSTLTATTGTAGSFGLTLYKPLTYFLSRTPGDHQYCNLINGGMGQCVEIAPDAALTFLIRTIISVTYGFSGHLIVAELD